MHPTIRLVTYCTVFLVESSNYLPTHGSIPLFGSLAHIRQEPRSQSLCVNGFRSPHGRMVHPYNGCTLEPIIKGNHAGHDIQQGFQNGNGRKDDPVREPLGVIAVLIGTGRIHGLEGHVGGIDKAQQIHQEFHATNQTQQPRRDHGQDGKEINLVVASRFFDLFEVFCNKNNRIELEWVNRADLNTGI